MKIVIINGQNHKGSTYHIGRIVAEKLGGEITEYFLPRDFDEFCCGCTRCFTENEKLCPHYEKLRPITEAIDKADVLVFTTPVYVYHCTGSMKAFLDHYGYRWLVHRPDEKMFSKQAVVVSTAAGAGMKSAGKDIRDSLTFWGVPKVYSIGAAVMATSWDGVRPEKKKRIESKACRVAAKIKSSGVKPRVSLKGRVFLTAIHFANKNDWNPADSEYWKEKGWTEKKRPWKKESVKE